MWGRLATCGPISKRPSPSFPDRLNLWLRLRCHAGQVSNLFDFPRPMPRRFSAPAWGSLPSCGTIANRPCSGSSTSSYLLAARRSSGKNQRHPHGCISCSHIFPVSSPKANTI